MKKTFPAQSVELALTAPLVISQRLAQLASLGNAPTAQDYRELNLMWTEKLFTFGEVWLAAGRETVRYQQKVLATSAGYWMMPWLLPQAMLHASIAHSPASGERLLRKTMAPIHGKVLANAERLAQQGI